MTTRMVSVRQFRQNFSQYLREAETKNVHFVILRHAEPVAHVKPVKKMRKTKKQKEIEAEAFWQEVQEARRQWERGEYYTQEEMEKRVGLR